MQLFTRYYCILKAPINYFSVSFPLSSDVLLYMNTNSFFQATACGRFIPVFLSVSGRAGKRLCKQSFALIRIYPLRNLNLIYNLFTDWKRKKALSLSDKDESMIKEIVCTDCCKVYSVLASNNYSNPKYVQSPDKSY